MDAHSRPPAGADFGRNLIERVRGMRRVSIWDDLLRAASPTRRSCVALAICAGLLRHRSFERGNTGVAAAKRARAKNALRASRSTKRSIPASTAFAAGMLQRRPPACVASARWRSGRTIARSRSPPARRLDSIARCAFRARARGTDRAASRAGCRWRGAPVGLSDRYGLRPPRRPGIPPRSDRARGRELRRPAGGELQFGVLPAARHAIGERRQH